MRASTLTTWAVAAPSPTGRSCSCQGQARDNHTQGSGGGLRLVSARLQVLVIAFHLGIGLAVLAAVTLLAALDKPITPVTAGIFGAVLGLAGAGGVAAATLGTALNGKSV